MTTNEQKRNEIIEQMLKSKWANIYANKLRNKFRNVTDAKGVIVSNMFIAIEIYERNHDLDNDEYLKIEKYVFQKAWQLSNDAELERLGKKRIGKKKELRQVRLEYNDMLSNEYKDVVETVDVKDVISEKDLAIKMIEGRLRSEQEMFIKSVLKLGVEQTKRNLGLNSKSFNNRLNRTIKTIQKKRDKYEVVSARANKLNNRLELINCVVEVLECEDSNEISIYKTLLDLHDSKLKYLFSKAFNGIDKEIAIQAFKENSGRQYAYRLVNALYAEKDKIENELKAVA